MAKTEHEPYIINGKEVSDETFDAWAEEYEKGAWTGHLSKVRMGRPRISDEDLVTITFRVPKSRVPALEAAAKRKGETRSEYLRGLVDRAIIQI